VLHFLRLSFTSRRSSIRLPPNCLRFFPLLPVSFFLPALIRRRRYLSVILVVNPYMIRVFSGISLTRSFFTARFSLCFVMILCFAKPCTVVFYPSVKFQGFNIIQFPLPLTFYPLPLAEVVESVFSSGRFFKLGFPPLTNFFFLLLAELIYFPISVFWYRFFFTPSVIILFLWGLAV